MPASQRTLTSKHHHVLEVGADLVASAQVEEEGEGVDVASPADKHRHLGSRSRSSNR